jgi:hypothetical protein
MALRPGIELANLSDVGCEREGNEDYFGYAEPEDDVAFGKKGRLVIVADGMGGYEGGQRASRIAVETIREVFLKSETSGFPELLVEGFREAHAKIREEAASTPGLESMGTTCVAAALVGATLHFANIGDSRLYLVRAHTSGKKCADGGAGLAIRKIDGNAVTRFRGIVAGRCDCFVHRRIAWTGERRRNVERARSPERQRCVQGVG